MSNDREESNSSLLAFASGVLVGGLIGTVVGIFMSPKSGTEMRHQFSENVHDTQNKTKQLFDDTKSIINENVDKATKNLETTIQKVTEAFNAGRKAAQDSIAGNSDVSQATDEKKSDKIDISDKKSDKIDRSDNKQSKIDSSDKENKNKLNESAGEELSKENKSEG